MSLLIEIQDAAIGGSEELSTILRKRRLLASRLKSIQLAEWVKWELEGYPTEIQVPKYRVMQMQLVGHFAGPFGAAIKNAPIPPYITQQLAGRDYSKFELRQSVGSIESMLLRSSDTIPSVPLDDLALLLGDQVYQGYNCVQLWGILSMSSFSDVQNGVRNRILELAIKIFEENSLAGEILGNEPAVRIGEARMTQIFNTTVHGGTASFVGSANDSQFTFNISAQNFGDVEEVLSRAGASKPDIADLRKALDNDPAPTNATEFGPKTKDWLKRMVGKAAEGTWNVSLATGARIAEEVVLRYYGLK